MLKNSLVLWFNIFFSKQNLGFICRSKAFENISTYIFKVGKNAWVNTYKTREQKVAELAWQVPVGRQ